RQGPGGDAAVCDSRSAGRRPDERQGVGLAGPRGRGRSRATAVTRDPNCSRAHASFAACHHHGRRPLVFNDTSLLVYGIPDPITYSMLYSCELEPILRKLARRLPVVGASWIG